jgi:hypothetical protein
MSTSFLNSIVSDIGITPTEVLSTIQSTRQTIIGLNVANITSSMIQISIMMVAYEANGDGSSNTDVELSRGYIMRNIMVPPQSTLKAVTNGEKLILSANNSLQVVSNAPTSVDVVVSYVSIT